MISQLHHGGVDPRIAGAAILPRLEQDLIVTPGYLSTDLVASHLIKIGREAANPIEELSPAIK